MNETYRKLRSLLLKAMEQVKRDQARYETLLRERDELAARIKVLEDAGAALIADVKRRHPGEELHCRYMRALDKALEEVK